MTFREQFKGDLDRFSPAPELLDRISVMMREEVEKPRPPVYASVLRYAGMAAAVCLLAFGAVRLGFFAPIESSTGGAEEANRSRLAETAAETEEMNGIAAYNDAFEIGETAGSTAAPNAAATAAAPPEARLDRGRAIGGDELALYYGLSDPSIAGIDGRIIDVIDIVDEAAFEEWRLAKESVGCTTDLAEEMNLYALICDFPQYKEAIRARLYELLEIDRANGWVTSLNEEEIALLLDGEKDAVSERFVSPAAVFWGGKIYSPEWLDTHEVSDYEAEGIPPERIREKLDEILWLSAFTDLRGLAEKLSVYLGETVELPVPTEKPEEAWDFPAEVEDEEVGAVYTEEIIEIPEE